MKKKWLLIVGPILMLVIVGLAGCGPGNTTLGEVENLNISSQQEGIWVTGQGKVTAVPDIATLRLGIEAQEASVAEAQSQAAEAMDRVKTALTKKGVANKDIQTQRFSIRQVTKWDRVEEEETVIGYRVTNMVTAKIRDIDKTGTIIDAVAEAGGDLTRVDSINFSIDDPLDFYEEARQEAMAEAKAKASQLAELAGVTLGKPTYISEGIQVPRPIYQPGVAYEERVESVETPISPGEIEISISIQIVYAILD
jgi:uncharacterized protein YggE